MWRGRALVFPTDFTDGLRDFTFGDEGAVLFEVEASFDAFLDAVGVFHEVSIGLDAVLAFGAIRGLEEDAFGAFDAFIGTLGEGGDDARGFKLIVATFYRVFGCHCELDGGAFGGEFVAGSFKVVEVFAKVEGIGGIVFGEGRGEFVIGFGACGVAGGEGGIGSFKNGGEGRFCIGEGTIVGGEGGIDHADLHEIGRVETFVVGESKEVGVVLVMLEGLGEFFCVGETTAFAHGNDDFVVDVFIVLGCFDPGHGRVVAGDEVLDHITAIARCVEIAFAFNLKGGGVGSITRGKEEDGGGDVMLEEGFGNAGLVKEGGDGFEFGLDGGGGANDLPTVLASHPKLDVGKVLAKGMDAVEEAGGVEGASVKVADEVARGFEVGEEGCECFGSKGFCWKGFGKGREFDPEGVEGGGWCGCRREGGVFFGGEVADGGVRLGVEEVGDEFGGDEGNGVDRGFPRLGLGSFWFLVWGFWFGVCGGGGRSGVRLLWGFGFVEGDEDDEGKEHDCGHEEHRVGIEAFDFIDDFHRRVYCWVGVLKRGWLALSHSKLRACCV